MLEYLDTVKEFQSTHPRGVRRHCSYDVITRLNISIHAPTRGATFALVLAKQFADFISIHAPTRGATALAPKCWLHRYAISIHAPTRGATVICRSVILLCYISIHAPTRGATSRTRSMKITGSYFNPRTHEGCDPAPTPPRCAEKIFQSTHPRGVRPQLMNIPDIFINFNPRTHEGCDLPTV